MSELGSIRREKNNLNKSTLKIFSCYWKRHPRFLFLPSHLAQCPRKLGFQLWVSTTALLSFTFCLVIKRGQHGKAPGPSDSIRLPEEAPPTDYPAKFKLTHRIIRCTIVVQTTKFCYFGWGKIVENKTSVTMLVCVICFLLKLLTSQILKRKQINKMKDREWRVHSLTSLSFSINLIYKVLSGLQSTFILFSNSLS